MTEPIDLPVVSRIEVHFDGEESAVYTQNYAFFAWNEDDSIDTHTEISCSSPQGAVFLLVIMAALGKVVSSLLTHMDREEE